MACSSWTNNKSALLKVTLFLLFLSALIFGDMTVTILYFAQIKEALGMAQEVVQLPDDIRQLHQLLTWLSQRHDRYARGICSLFMCARRHQ